jgi:hypothetical protein
MADQSTPVTGVLRIEIPTPALSVTLTFEVSEDGDEWDAQRVANAVAERGVKGVPEEQILRLLTEAVTNGGPVAATVLEGTPPELPSPERVEWVSAEPTAPESTPDARDVPAPDTENAGDSPVGDASDRIAATSTGDTPSDTTADESSRDTPRPFGGGDRSRPFDRRPRAHSRTGAISTDIPGRSGEGGKAEDR